MIITRFLSPLSGFVFLALIICSCRQAQRPGTDFPPEKKIGVLLVHHDPGSGTWRNDLLTIGERVKEAVLAPGFVAGIRSAFAGRGEPSIATQLKAFDNEGFTDVILVPLVLTLDPHAFDDLPAIIGEQEEPRAIERIKAGNIERYRPIARTYITPGPDFPELLRKNIVRRCAAMSRDAGNEGLVLVAGGDSACMQEWRDLLGSMGEYVAEETGIKNYSFGWCGQAAGYDPDSSAAAVRRVLARRRKALVIPVLAAHDELFQVKIIGEGIRRAKKAGDAVLYRADAILPDEGLEDWIVRTTGEFAYTIFNGEKVERNDRTSP